MIFPSYRNRYLPAMTAAEIDALPDKASIPVVIATGAIEQHGRHMPVAVDSLLAQVWLDRSIPLLPEETRLLVAPPITYGKSNEHVGFPGTVFISKRTLRRQLFCIARQLHAWGFRTMAVLNTHGGNISVLKYTLREIHKELGLSVGFVRSRFSFSISEQEASYGFHAGEVETSWMLDAWGEHIDMSEAACEFPARVEDPGELRPEAASAIFSWVTSDLSKSGVMGDATLATPEKGREWARQGAETMAEALLSLERWAADRHG